jgi:CheY-like chemotaxis protein
MLSLSKTEPLAVKKCWRVLLVDDEEFNHEILELSLNKTDFSLISATSVAEAMKIVETAPPDILITDAMMPGESGFSLIEKIRSQPQTADLPIILWTVLELPDGSVMDASRKADFTVSKPFYHSTILEALDKARDMAAYRILAAPAAADAGCVHFIF